MMTQYLPTDYQTYIHTSRYSRWREDLGRREFWPETVQRWYDFWFKYLTEHTKLDEQEIVSVLAMLADGILRLDVMPSMRSLMTAGPALERDELASFNCSYCAIDSVSTFSEILFILLCGVGVGFSVERQFVVKLTMVAEEFYDTDTTIVVADSKLGWAHAFKELLSLLWSGRVPKWDLSKVRPAGAPLKKFGGRASGPGPLESLFKFSVHLIKGAAGRRLNSIECHDLVCKIADIVVVGGVRRAALISLSNLSDDRMRNAKNGQWWVDTPYRALANNSVAYTERPDYQVFLKEWFTLYESKSGERGLFNRVAATKKAKENGRRKVEGYEYGLNPCFAPETLILTKQGHFPISSLVGKTVDVWDGNSWVEIDSFRVTGRDKDTLDITLHDGSVITTTSNHRFILDDGRSVEAKDLSEGDSLFISTAPTVTEGEKVSGAYVKGFLIGDGTHSDDKPILWLYPPKYVCSERIIDSVKEISCGPVHTNSITNVSLSDESNGRKTFTGVTVRRHELYKWSHEYKKGLPRDVFSWDHKSKCDFIAGLFDSDGTASETRNGFMYQFTGTEEVLLRDIQFLLKTIGVNSSLRINKEAGITNFNDGYGFYETKRLWRLTISQTSSIALSKQVKFSRLVSFSERQICYNLKPKFNKVVSVVQGKRLQEVYCCTVPTNNQITLSAGVITGQCAEILMRNKGLCNLSSVVVRPEDTVEDLHEKIKQATIIGTIQSLLTHYRFLPKEWQRNAEEERLLGVSFTGIMDHPILGDYKNKDLPGILHGFKQTAIDVNNEWALKLGINQSVALSCVKPEGTLSQMVRAASGIHPIYNDYYIRRVLGDNKDPVTQFMVASGIPNEKSNYPGQTVFSFPMKAPEGAITRKQVDALQQLELYRVYRDNWTEHNPSITVYYEDKNFLGVGQWVWENFDNITGVAFLPTDNGIYQQAPYEDITKEEYERMSEAMPVLDWTKLAEYEKEDRTTSTRELSCSAGVCEL